MTLFVEKFDFDTCTQVSDQYRILVKKYIFCQPGSVKNKKKKEVFAYLPTLIFRSM